MGVTSDNPTIPSLSATRTACDFVSEWIDKNCRGKKVVTITLREASYEIDRNSNIQDWVKFARSLDRDIYVPVYHPGYRKGISTRSRGDGRFNHFLRGQHWNLA